MLDVLLDRFTEKGSTELEAGALRVPPFRHLGTVRQLAARFGGAPQMHEAIDDLAKRIFDVA